MERKPKLNILIYPRNDGFCGKIKALLDNCDHLVNYLIIHEPSEITPSGSELVITWLDGEAQLDFLERFPEKYPFTPVIVFIEKKDEKWRRELPRTGLIHAMILEESGPVLLGQAIDLLNRTSISNRAAESALIKYSSVIEENLLETVTFPIDRNGVPGHLETASRVFLRKRGFKSSEIRSKFLSDLMDEDDVARFRKTLIDLFHKTKSEIVLRLKNRFGMKKSITLHLQLIRTRDSFWVNATVFKKGKKTAGIPGESDILDEVVNAIPFPLYYKDSQGRYLGCNRSFEETFSIINKDLYGKTMFDILPKEIAVTAARREERLLKSGGQEVYLGNIGRPSPGAPRDALFVKATFPNNDTTPRGFVSMILNIDEYISESQRFKDMKGRYESVFGNSPYGALFIEAGIVVSANRSFLRMMNYSSEKEISGNNLIGMFAGASLKEMNAMITDVLAEPGAIRTVTTNMIGGNGGISSQKIILHSLELSGKTVLYLFLERL